ncbi:MFS transporter [Bradyrhizobium sp. AUGA SZCCT0283]|uniref:MFS transporter n=1 Tax=Bradyrhizobium sp. AUGA SZCCT0283 TaxID=2807671 RepID=UPI001BAA84F6|nr:MFS transporter [Bradyrhizobium sp. AUGA SZCCT0283]MBR1278787.1 MFS transporter [Bradyrhizobium sp. AUGA SZCCT0283]
MVAAGRFFGWSVAWSAFAIAVFAWGIGFYGPSVFLQSLHETRGWPISQISMAVTGHFLLSAIVIACLPEIHRRLGIAKTTFLGAVLTAAGLILWSGAREPWQLFAAVIPSGAGWAMTSGAALNAIVARWFDRDRPIAIALAFNGASVGGVLFVPMWVWLIRSIGFPSAALLVGGCMVAMVGYLCVRFLAKSPEDMGLTPDGDASHQAGARPKPRRTRIEIVRSWLFITISAAFSLGLFAQIGLLAHLVARLSPELGIEQAGLLVSLATVCAVIGRTAAGKWIGEHDRRFVAAVNFAVQISGVLLLIFGSGSAALTLGCVLFGLGIGNLTSLPPLIVQKEFEPADVATAVALIIAINQGVFAFAPAIIGAMHDTTANYQLPFALIALIQLLAAAIILLGRRSTRTPATSP